MKARPIVAFLLYQVLFGALQYLTTLTSFGVASLLAAWSLIVVATWVDNRIFTTQIAQTAIQTVVFGIIIAYVYSGLF